MLHISNENPPTREQVFDFIKSLPEDMILAHRTIEFELELVTVSSIDDPKQPSKDRIFSVALIFERKL